MRQEMRQGELPSRNAVLDAIPLGIEPRDGLPALGLAVLDVVQQRLQPILAHVAVAAQVPCGVEIWVRPPALAPAVAGVMHQRVEPGLVQVGIAFQEPRQGEQA